MWGSINAWLKAQGFMILNGFYAVFYRSVAFTYWACSIVESNMRYAYGWIEYVAGWLGWMAASTFNSLVALWQNIVSPLAQGCNAMALRLSQSIIPAIRACSNAILYGVKPVIDAVQNFAYWSSTATATIRDALRGMGPFVQAAFREIDATFYDVEKRVEAGFKALSVRANTHSLWLNHVLHPLGVLADVPLYWSLYAIRRYLVSLLGNSVLTGTELADVEQTLRAHPLPSPDQINARLRTGYYDAIVQRMDAAGG